MTGILDHMSQCHNQITYSWSQDYDFMLKAFNSLESSSNEDFLSLIKKKRDSWEEDELEDNVDGLIQVCSKKNNNISQSKYKLKPSKSSKEDQ